MKADRLRGKKTDIVLDYVLDKPSKHHGERTVPSAFVHRHSIRRTVFLTRSVPQPAPPPSTSPFPPCTFPAALSSVNILSSVMKSSTYKVPSSRLAEIYERCLGVTAQPRSDEGGISGARSERGLYGTSSCASSCQSTPAA